MEIIRLLEQTARGAGDKLHGSREIVSQKEGGGNFVTEADLASERHIIDTLAQNIPGAVFLAEETRSTLARPESIAKLFIIDPLDGTTNFARGLPCYTISLAYAEYGVVKCGVVFDPTRDEMFSAALGSGAYNNGRKILCTQEHSLNGALVDLGCPYKPEDFRPMLPKFATLHERGCRIVNLGSAALQCAYIASGRLSAYFEYGIKPWDIAAGSLLIHEAGGRTRYATDSESLFQFTGFLGCTSGLLSDLSIVFQAD